MLAHAHAKPPLRRCNAPRAGWSALAALALTACLAGCGQSAPAPVDVVESYENALAVGNYARACSLLDPGARVALVRTLHHRASCPRVFARCLPNQATNARRDQAQLLFANVAISQTRRGLVARLSGNPVAAAIRQVLIEPGRRGTWHLASYGDGLKGCPGRRHRRQGPPAPG